MGKKHSSGGSTIVDTPTVDLTADLSKVDLSDNSGLLEDRTEKKDEETKSPDKKRTKKSVVITFLDKEGGSSIDDIAKEIVDLKMDPDLDKNKRVVRLWISKIGFKVDSKKDEAGVKKYFRAI